MRCKCSSEKCMHMYSITYCNIKCFPEVGSMSWRQIQVFDIHSSKVWVSNLRWPKDLKYELFLMAAQSFLYFSQSESSSFWAKQDSLKIECRHHVTERLSFSEISLLRSSCRGLLWLPYWEQTSLGTAPGPWAENLSNSICILQPNVLSGEEINKLCRHSVGLDLTK